MNVSYNAFHTNYMKKKEKNASRPQLLKQISLLMIVHFALLARGNNTSSLQKPDGCTPLFKALGKKEDSVYVPSSNLYK